MARLRRKQSSKSSRLKRYQNVKDAQTLVFANDLVDDWKNCKLCPLHCNRTSVVHWRGQLPCDVLFIGEAPGESEDVIGVPFIGPAGSLLRELVSEAETDYDSLKPFPFEPTKWAATNIVACLPLDEDGNLRPPKKAEAKACSDRLIDFIEIAQPEVIVTLGQVAEKYLPRTNVPHFNLIHPAAILRSETKYVLLRKKFIIGLRDILETIR